MSGKIPSSSSLPSTNDDNDALDNSPVVNAVLRLEGFGTVEQKIEEPALPSESSPRDEEEEREKTEKDAANAEQMWARMMTQVQ